MKTIVLKIAFDNHQAGDKVDMENDIARHFIAKGWGSEAEIVEETEDEVPQIKRKKGKK